MKNEMTAVEMDECRRTDRMDTTQRNTRQSRPCVPKISIDLEIPRGAASFVLYSTWDDMIPQYIGTGTETGTGTGSGPGSGPGRGPGRGGERGEMCEGMGKC